MKIEIPFPPKIVSDNIMTKSFVNEKYTKEEFEQVLTDVLISELMDNKMKADDMIIIEFGKTGKRSYLFGDKAKIRTEFNGTHFSITDYIKK